MNQQQAQQARRVVMFAEINVYFRKEHHETLGTMKSFKMAGCQAEGDCWMQVVQASGMAVYPREVIAWVEMIPSMIDQSAAAPQ